MASTQRTLNAVVVSAGLMQKTVKVRIGHQKWNNAMKKHFKETRHLLVHDPRSSLRLGDVIMIAPGWRYSKHVHHVVTSIIAPFGTPVEERPPVPTEEERLEERRRKYEAKKVRREERALADGTGERVDKEIGTEEEIQEAQRAVA